MPPAIGRRILNERRAGHCGALSALRPANCSHRWTMTSEYGASSSIMKHRRTIFSQAMSVLPDPPKKSARFSPARLEYSMARRASCQFPPWPL